MPHPALHALPTAALLALAPATPRALAQSYDLRFNWSTTDNPAGPWSYRAASIALPPIADWQPAPSPNWSTPQPGWAAAASGSPGATPFWFKSNGAETFDHDWLLGDIIVRTRDPADGTGNGAGGTGPGGPGTGNSPANFTWTSPLDGVITLVGTVWPARPHIPYHQLTLTASGTPIWGNFFSPATNYTHAAPQIFQISNTTVLRNDQLVFTADNRSGGPGDFIGVNLNIVVCIGVTQQPAHAFICPGGNASISVQARTSYGTLNYRWRKNGVPLLEGQAGRFHGVFGPSLSISNFTAADVTIYDCVVGSVCSALPSDAASITVCRADFNCSGSLEIADVFDYLNAWMASDPRADLDGTPGLTMNDVLTFVSAWFTGC